ncbi:hypothetical protein F511_19400 [Dorcoceras hygrometricum]|uniref:Uncharacterized protein n=1 Tax=Dorcoceras hygrometricum TaxID=472368 RepID=A0A2Z7D4J4_9LAMI|nr:hypothetical protein F511_19400 [Dorcoceras hygrometricum]
MTISSGDSPEQRVRPRVILPSYRRSSAQGAYCSILRPARRREPDRRNIVKLDAYERDDDGEAEGSCSGKSNQLDGKPARKQAQSLVLFKSRKE